MYQKKINEEQLFYYCIMEQNFKNDTFRVLLINDSMRGELYYSHLQDLVKRGLVGILNPKFVAYST